MNKLKSDHTPSENRLAFSVVFIAECKNNSWKDQKCSCRISVVFNLISCRISKFSPSSDWLLNH